MTDRDPELTALLLGELRRHLDDLRRAPDDVEAARRTVHGMRGAASLAGERGLAGSLESLERRLRGGDAAAIGESATVLADAAEALRHGESVPEPEWPTPPPWLGPPRIDDAIRAQYLAEATDRIAAIDEAMLQEQRVLESARVVYRQIHTLKGAASAVGDEPMAWFCHGLEELLRGARTELEAEAALREVASFRAVLASLVDQPERALAALRAGTSGRAESVPPPATESGEALETRTSIRPGGGPVSTSLSALRPESRSPKGAPGSEEPPRSRLDVPTVRVAADAIDRLIDHWEAMGLVGEYLASGADDARVQAERLRRTRASLVEALRLIGPPRPWGAPAAAIRRIDAAANMLTAVTEELDEAGLLARSREHTVREALEEAKRSLSAMRLTTAGRLFGRLSRTLEAEAARLGRVVVVQVRGAQEPLDRRLAEALLDPCMQLVRNAVAHGIEAPEVRGRVGKPKAGTVTLAARRVRGRVVVAVEDDGAGVDLVAVRRRAVDARLLSREAAEALDDTSALALLVVPGLTTAPEADLLAGRGLGLDVVQSAVRRLGGSLRLSSRRHRGFTARIDVPGELGLTRVLWVEADGETYAIPAVAARRVHLRRDMAGRAVMPLATCLDGQPRDGTPLVVELDPADPDGGDTPVAVGVDAVGRTEDLLLRPLSPLVTGIGPYAGVVVRQDGALHLALDVDALVPRLRGSPA